MSPVDRCVRVASEIPRFFESRLPRFPLYEPPSVSTIPGFTALARMPRGPNSLARDLVTAFYRSLGRTIHRARRGAEMPATEPILIMLPPSSPLCFAACWAARISPSTFTSNCL
jgi:hypothetical protein